MDLRIGDGPDVDVAFGVRGFEGVHQGVAFVAGASVVGVEVGGGYGVEELQIVVGGSHIELKHGFGDFGFVGGSGGAGFGLGGEGLC